MDLEYLVYTPLMEDEQEKLKGWDKITINYLVENEKMIKKSISKSLGKRRMSSINSSDIDDIYSEVLLYLYEVDDYNISKAVVETDDGKKYIIPLEGYVFKSIEFCIKRYITKKFDRESLIVNTEVRTPEDNILDILNTITDNKTDTDFEHVTVDLNQHCKECESIRYKYGVDIYQMWFIGLLVLDNKLEDDYFDIMNILGISRRDLREISKQAYEDDTLLEFAIGINKHGVKESINILEQYVYSADQVKKAIKKLSVLEVV